MNRWRHGKYRFDKPQQILLRVLAEQASRRNSILEIGCGIGHLHKKLLSQSVNQAQAIGIDLAPQMIAEARRDALQRGLDDQTTYINDDFMTMSTDIPACDLTVLDKVICCYPDAEGLVAKSLHKTKQTYALIYPRDKWYVRVGIFFGGVLMAMIRSNFRPYFHDPVMVQANIEQLGFVKTFEAVDLSWLIQVYSIKTGKVV